MTTVKLDIPQLVEHHRLLGKNLQAALRRGLVSGGMRARVIVQQATRRAPAANPGGIGTGGAVNYGVYLSSWKSRPITGSRMGVRVFNDAPYAGVIEYGRRPGARMPPVDAIMRWAQRRLTTSAGTYKSGAKKGQTKTRRFSAEAGSDDELMLRAIAWNIARAIKRRGLRGRHVMGRAQKDMARAVFLEVLHEFDAALPGGLGGGP